MYPAEKTKILTVGQLTAILKSLVEDAFPAIWVTGEISSFKRHSSGHLYFTLKDAEAQIKSVIWRQTASQLNFTPEDGMEVIARGRLDIYPPHGEYKLIVDELHPKGLGAQEAALRQLKEKLKGMGYFDPARKKPLPRFPTRLAVVTSPTGAALRDILKVLSRRWPLLEIWVCAVRVQGEGAGKEIAAAIRRVNAIHATGRHLIDVLIVGRGGGAQEDLWAFNEEIVAHALFRSQIPVVSAVGHEIDLTIADLVADRRAATPSEAAELVAPDRNDILEHIEGIHERLREQLRNRLHQARLKLEELSSRRPFRFPLAGIEQSSQHLDETWERLDRVMEQRLAVSLQRLESASGKLESLSPLNVLARGYSLTRRDEDKFVIRSFAQVQTGDRLETLLSRGRITSIVESTSESPNG